MLLASIFCSKDVLKVLSKVSCVFSIKQVCWLSGRLHSSGMSGMEGEGVKRTYEMLQQNFDDLHDSYEQLKRRLQATERSKNEIERRHQNDLMKLTGELKIKIQRLEANQKTKELDVEEMKENLKNEFADVFERRNFELTSELDVQRHAYNEIRFQYSILKNEFESLQRTTRENEDKFRLQNETLSVEFGSEKSLLLARIEQLSNSVETNSLHTSDQRKYSFLERKCEQFESDLKISNELKSDLESRSKSERRSNEIIMNDLKKELRSAKHLNSSLQQDFDSMKSENVQLNAKIDVYERRQLNNEKILHALRSSNETLKEKLKNDVDEINSRLRIEIIQLEKERDQKNAENEELMEKVKTLDADLLSKRRRLDEIELHIEEIKQNFKLSEVEQREIWSNEKRELETKLRDAETERRRTTMKLERNLYNLELKLKQSDFEKEKTAEELVELKMQLSRTKNDENSFKTDENAREQTNSVVKNLSDEIKTLKNELEKREILLNRVETKFDLYQEKNVQFYEILKLCESQILKPNAVDEIQTDLMNEIRKELKKLTLKKERKEKKSVKSKRERSVHEENAE